MPLRVVLLTTETAHHRYYAWRVHEQVPFMAVIVEAQRVTPPFETSHPFEERRETYERETLLNGRRITFADLTATRSVNSVNDVESLEMLRALAPDILVVFGTGRLLAPVIRSAGLACLNLHGGNPEYYRGLDSHLWAIYHEDFGNLVTTLHHIDEGLDTGDLVRQSRLELASGSQLHELRAINTTACVELTRETLTEAERTGSIPAQTPSHKGRYYSFMPSTLKARCVEKFQQYMATR